MPYICTWCGAHAPYLRGQQPCDCSRRVLGRKEWPKNQLAAIDLARLDVQAKRELIREEA